MEKKNIFISFLTILIVSMSVRAGNSEQNLSYTISLNKSSYLPLEPIIIISKLKNTGINTIEVNEPSGMAFVVTYDLYKVDPNGRQKVGSRIQGRGRPAWTAQKFILKPNDTGESSCELDLQIRYVRRLGSGNDFDPPGLKYGDYILKATYHLGDYGTPSYEKNIINSNEASFTIKKMDDKQTLICYEFTKYIADDRDPKNQESKLSEFLNKYPNSPYQQMAIDTLISDKYEIGDYKGAILYYQAQLKGEISVNKQERIISGLASAYLKLGNLKEAITVLSNAKIPQSVWLKEQLEKGKIPLEYR